MRSSASGQTRLTPRRAWPAVRPEGDAQQPLRTALFVISVGAMVLIYLLWWTTYAGIHGQDRFVQQPPGAAGQVGGTRIRLLSLTRSEQLAMQKYGGGPAKQSSPGTVWVVAVFEAVPQAGAPEFYCTFELVGPDGRRWKVESEVNRTRPSCLSRDTTPDRAAEFESIFLVPERFADQIVGVALSDPTVPDRVPVITPPG
jgi:hypothetical protein